MRIQMFAAAVLAAATMSGSPARASDPMTALEGHWVSLACELRPQQGPNGATDWYLKRDIRFSASGIDARFTSFADRDCKAPLSELHFAGKAIYRSPSEVAQGALAVDLSIDKTVELTAFMQGFADFLNSAGAGGCGAELFTVGKAQDVRVTGCKPIGLPANAVTTEYETLLVRGDLLFFGARPIDGSLISSEENRPTALQMPLVRSE